MSPVQTYDSDKAFAHTLARLALGLTIAMHGYVRLPQLDKFASGMQKEFAATFLPGGLVYATGCGIAVAEVLIGTLLVLGLFLRLTLVAGTLLMMLLLFGVCLLQKWDLAGLQLSYVAFYAALLATAGWDRYSVDAMRRSG
jgi:thiosulfate dehydrogenase [quinone] large subunit